VVGLPMPEGIGVADHGGISLMLMLMVSVVMAHPARQQRAGPAGYGSGERVGQLAASWATTSSIGTMSHHTVLGTGKTMSGRESPSRATMRMVSASMSR
jgi:hypothetical protein